MSFREQIEASSKHDYEFQLSSISKETILSNYEDLLQENLQLKELIKQLEIAILMHDVKMDFGLHHDLSEALKSKK